MRGASLFSRFLADQSAWRNGLVHPIYVPNDLSYDVRALLSGGKIVDAARELWKLASLGSMSAAPLLGYLCLRDPNLCGTDRGSVYERCKESASRRDSFAQYVLAWAEYERGNYRNWFHWLTASARQHFLPAIGDLAKVLISPSVKGKMRPDLSMRCFSLAIRRGHLISIMIFLDGCRRGAFGRVCRLAGMVFWPISILPVWLAMKFLPFSASIFIYPVGTKRPLFK